jgi:hypothetical protein
MKKGFLLRMEQKRQMGKVMRLLTAKPGDQATDAVLNAREAAHE